MQSQAEFFLDDAMGVLNCAQSQVIPMAYGDFRLMRCFCFVGLTNTSIPSGSIVYKTRWVVGLFSHRVCDLLSYLE